MEKTFQTRQTQKKDTCTNWSNNNPVLLDGEIAFEETSGNTRMKVGDGKTAYNSLPVIATTEETTIADVNGLQAALNGKAASSHTHDYAASSSAGGAATKAVGDGNGNNIANTYCTKVELQAQIAILEAKINALNLGFAESEDDM